MTRYSPPRLYLYAVGMLLTFQGTIGILIRLTGRDPHATTRLLSDPVHSSIHVIWGIAMLAACARDDSRLERRMLLAFGAFYLGFLVLGVAVHHPFGMQIDGKENAFHAVIGPLALLVWALDLRRRRLRHPVGAAPDDAAGKRAKEAS